MEFSKRGDLLMVLTLQGIEVFLYKKDLHFKKLIMNNPKVDKRPIFGFFSDDQRFLTSLHGRKQGDTYLAYWDLMEDKNCLTKVEKLSEIPISTATVNSDQTLLGYGNADGETKIYDLALGRFLNTFKFHSLGLITGVQFSAGSNDLKSGGPDYKFCK